MYFTNENHTELYYERQDLLRTTSNTQLPPQLRAVRPKGSPRSERHRVSFGRAIASLWERISVPFFRA